MGLRYGQTWQSFDDWGKIRSLRVDGSNMGETLRAFPMHQIYLEDGIFHQTRSGPNWQGGVMTLSTCKHWMRCANVEWRGTWLAGFTPKVGCGGNYLLFLARIWEVLPSNYALGQFLRKTAREAWKRKLATESRVGDVYLPVKPLGVRAVHNPSNYYTPHGHVRMENDKKTGRPKWERDINYVGTGGRRPVSFVMEQVTLFQGPEFVTTRPLHRSGYKGTVQELVDTTRRVR